LQAKRVAVAMSGGVDSSVACLLLKRQGYDVIGLTMKLLPNPPSQDVVRAPCCTLEMAQDAMRICHSLGIPHYTIDLVEEFDESVILPFVREYFLARTPNPCLQCNRAMKFGHLLRKARELGCDYIATGHYARVRHRTDSESRALLMRGVDRTKDQSYALYQLTQDELERSLFPLGDLTKEEVRRIARESGLRTADKPESQEICFVAGSYREFLSGRGLEAEPGDIVDTSGKVLGRHAGLPFYTVGQRKGLGVAGGEPLYVVDLDRARNAVVVGKRSEAYSMGCVVEGLNVIADNRLRGSVRGTCMVRYRGKEVGATMEPLSYRQEEPDSAVIRFGTPEFAVTPGQSAVLYQDDLVYGGGVIAKRLGKK
jgi:tRNA-specific 2-thiouridylase